STLMQLEQTQPAHTVDLDAFVRSTIQRWSGVADRRWLAASIAGTITVNEERLQAAVDSLIENAIRFTGEGDAVELDAWRERGHAVIEVRDRPPPTPQTDHHHIFPPIHPRGPPRPP